MSQKSIHIIQAQPNTFVVYDMDDINEIERGEPVIAWRIETYEEKANTPLYSSCTPLTVDGEPASNCIGIQNPDLTVTTFQQSTYGSLQELQKERYPKNKS
ncbi:hypothetical protein [Pseudomonas sp. UBA2684]|uniref:hypothetical protein n=1 Tax=Pseudomonas sp. UBA2684 TaxID=1947311 RepID=UPI0026014455|nr:hypothetical protein [Pseudomonas sp. UBA2684]|tara:strand:- start:386 stop:688 length:303 start_codon:yes stop_codon:yes gene_type:complete